MKKYTDLEIHHAISLRKKYLYSFVQLQKLTGIPATTIRNWCSNFKGNKWETLLATNQRKRDVLLNSELNAVNSVLPINTSFAKIYAALLYWCEGAKYPSTHRVAFTNSDPQLIKLFVNLLRKAFDLDEKKFNLRLQLHTTHDVEKINKYWSKLLNIPYSRILKPTITSPRGKKHKFNYMGTCTVRYEDYRIQLKLIGIYQKFPLELI